MNVLCIGRHPYLSDFLAGYFRDAMLHTSAAVGLDDGEQAARTSAFDVVICDYDLLAPLAPERWSSLRVLCTAPVIAVSLTRRADEAPTLDTASFVLYLYLPTVNPENARQIVTAVGRPVPYSLPAFDRSRELARPSA